MDMQPMEVNAIDDNKFSIRIPWGTFGLNGEWEHNHLLNMTRSEQLEVNVRNGYLPLDWRTR